MQPREIEIFAMSRHKSLLAKTMLAIAPLGLAAIAQSVMAQDAVPTNSVAAASNAAPPPVSMKPKAPKNDSKQKDRSTLRVVPMQRSRGSNLVPPAGAKLFTPDGRFAAPPVGSNLPIPPEMPVKATTFSFDFHGSDISNILKFYSQMSGLTITADKDLTGPVTIICPKQVTLDESFKILQSVLAVRGFTALQDGAVISIVSFKKAVGSTTIVIPNGTGISSTQGGKNGVGSAVTIVPNGTGAEQLDPRNQVMTMVIPLENVDAETLARELLPLINEGASLIGSGGTNALILTDSSSNVKRFLTLVNALDKSSNSNEMKVYPLKHAEASAIADIINNIYKQITTRGRGSGAGNGLPGGGGGPPVGFNPGNPGQPQQAAGGRPSVLAVPDSRTNSVIVIASADAQERVATTIIARLDDDESNTLETKVRKIIYSDAVSIANLVNTVLSNQHGTAASSSSSGSSFQNRAFGGFGGFFGGGGGQSNSSTTDSSDPFGKVAADPRTNSLLITASADKMGKIEELITQLDVNVPAETSTFVIPLKNAQAADVAYALGQAFQTSQIGSNNNIFNFGGGGNNNNNNGTNRQAISRRLGNSSSSTNGRSARRNGIPPGPPNAPEGYSGSQVGDGSNQSNGVSGVMTPQGFVPYETAAEIANNQDNTRQFFGGGRGGFGGFGSQSNQSNAPQYGRGRSGTYSNLLQLQNNVYITASPGGDSIIVTTPPANYKAVMDVVEALDVVQRQVMIEVIVAEVSLDADKKMGLSLNGNFAKLFGKSNTAQTLLTNPIAGATTTLDPAAAGGQFVINSSNYNALIQALATDSKVKVISTPRVFTSNSQAAEIDITTQIPYINGQTASSFVSTNVSNSVQFLNVGFILNVTPRITRGGQVTIDVQQEASDLLRYDTLGTGISAIRAPVVNDRYADTSVTAQDGETIVIGGLIRNSNSLNTTKVPFISEIPLIGQFFRSREVVQNKVELMIFLTPHVVANAQEARDIARKSAAFISKELPNLAKEQSNLDITMPQPPLKANRVDRSDSMPKENTPKQEAN